MAPFTDEESTAELYLPSSNESCTLPNMPECDYSWMSGSGRYSHTVSKDGLVCGGVFMDYTCTQWTPETGSWGECIVLDEGREGHVSWTPNNGSGTYLMGGTDSRSSTTLIRPDGTVEPGFELYRTVM